MPEAAAPSLDRVDGVERRVCSRALAAWRALAAPRRFPAGAQIDALEPTDLKDHFFVLSVPGDSARSTCVSAGTVMQRAIGRDPTGRALSELLPPPIGQKLLGALRDAVATGAPVADSGRWARPDGSDDVYRAVLMPLSDDQRTIDAVLGAINFRTITYN